MGNIRHAKNGETEKEMVMFKKLTLRRTENRDALKKRSICVYRSNNRSHQSESELSGEPLYILPGRSNFIT